jgi:hypothetical protein
MEDPIEKLHKIDRLMDAVYCHLQDYEFREESKTRQEAIDKKSAVKKQMHDVTHSRKRKFAAATLLKWEQKTFERTIIKKECRSFEGAAPEKNRNKNRNKNMGTSVLVCNFGSFWCHLEYTRLL